MLLTLFRHRMMHAYGKVYSPCRGRVYPICEVKDHIIAEKMLGDGFAVIPEDGMVKAPADGTITMIYPDGHLFSMETDDGQQIMVHVGLDTQAEQGRGFHILKKSGMHVHHGDAVLKFDDEMRTRHDMSVITVMPCCADLSRTEIHLERAGSKEPIIEYGED